MDTIFFYVALFALFGVSLLKDRQKTKAALMKGFKAFEGILPQFIVVLILIALGLAFFDSQFVSANIGESSGIIGTSIAALVGSVTLIPGFVAFPLAGELLRNGAGVLQTATFVSALMMVGIVTLPLEISCFGKRAAILRNLMAFVFSFAAAFFVAWMVSL